jgi:hypothetical protein
MFLDDRLKHLSQISVALNGPGPSPRRTSPGCCRTQHGNLGRLLQSTHIVAVGYPGARLAYVSASATMLTMSAAKLAIAIAMKPLSALSIFFITATLLAKRDVELGLMLIH